MICSIFFLTKKHFNLFNINMTYNFMQSWERSDRYFIAFRNVSNRKFWLFYTEHIEHTMNIYIKNFTNLKYACIIFYKNYFCHFWVRKNKLKMEIFMRTHIKHNTLNKRTRANTSNSIYVNNIKFNIYIYIYIYCILLKYITKFEFCRNFFFHYWVCSIRQYGNNNYYFRNQALS